MVASCRGHARPGSKTAVGLKVGQCAAGGANFRGKYLEHFEGQHGVGFHHAGEVIAVNETQPGSFVGNGGERVWLVANESRKSQQRTGVRFKGRDHISRGRCHAHGDLALVENIEA